MVFFSLRIGTQPQFQFNLRAESYTSCAVIVGKVHVTQCLRAPMGHPWSKARSGERKGIVQQSTNILGDTLIKIKVIRLI